nr:MAG TPA: hypothetical protein [Caudoviricetes sp.]
MRKALRFLAVYFIAIGCAGLVFALMNELIGKRKQD